MKQPAPTTVGIVTEPDRGTDEFRVFVGMVSEIQDHAEHEAAYTADIREEAKSALERHPSA
jgi:hypothetical protein